MKACSLSRKRGDQKPHYPTTYQLGALLKFIHIRKGSAQLLVSNKTEASGKRFVSFSLHLMVEINVGHVQEVGVSV